MSRIRSIMFCLAAMFLFTSFMASAAQEQKQKHAPNALPGVEPEMLTASYWIALQPDADKVIMTPAQIEKFNEHVRTKTVRFNDTYGGKDPLEGGLLGYTDLEKRGSLMRPLKPLDMPETLPGDSLRVWFGNLETLLKSQDFYDGRNAIWSDEMKQNLLNDMNRGAVPAVVHRRFGIVVGHSDMRFFPTDVPGYGDIRWEMDLFQATSMLIGNPVAILHESTTGDYYYVETPIQRGWIAAGNVALGTREEVRNLIADKNFLMATGDHVPIYGDPGFKNFVRNFYYAATIPLASHDAKGYILKMPYRAIDGSIGIAKGYVRPDADVHIGYLPYTKKNVLVQIFKLLNQPYGWLDQDNKRACSGTMRVLLKCFNIEVGALPSFILLAPDHVVYYDPKMSVEEKTNEVEKLEPVITMAGDAGHIVLLLGKAKNGKLYFMHQAGWGYEENGQEFIVNRVSINPADFKWYHISGARVFSTFLP
jgi:hypothetical protein